jgi:ubiquinone/menaquinone biosynthesis C-methylase UbiE
MDKDLFSKLECIRCRGRELEDTGDKIICSSCGQKVSLHSGIPDFLSAMCVKEVAWKDKNNTGDAYENSILQTPEKRLKRIDEPILRYANGDVLEIGCGTCRLGPRVESRGAVYFGLDPLMNFLSYAGKKRDMKRLIRGQAERLPFRDEAFDNIISGYYAYRYVDAKTALPEARRVLKENGVFVFDILNHWRIKLSAVKGIIKRDIRELRNFKWKVSPDLFEFVNYGDLKNKAETAGFVIQDIFSTPAMPFFSFFDKDSKEFYYSRKPLLFLGRDIIVVLKAV